MPPPCSSSRHDNVGSGALFYTLQVPPGVAVIEVTGSLLFGGGEALEQVGVWWVPT
jgi:hypothetical protein